MTAPTTETLMRLRAIRDRLGEYGDLFMRLNGFYRIGPDGPAEPEFGYRDFRNNGVQPAIQIEASQAIVALRERVAKLEWALSDMIAVAEQDGWDKSMSGRQIIIRNSRAALNPTEVTHD